MLYDGLRHKCGEESTCTTLGFAALLVQGIATSIDALSVGFTISNYQFIEALLSALIIALVTFIICLIGVFIGKKVGTCLAGKASILGGIILIAIGLEIFISGIC
jgi:putative Mn2+ efflux pump MntP